MDIKKLVSEMTIEEKASLCSGASFWKTQGIDRLGIPEVMMTDGPCGIRKQGGKADHLGINESVVAVSFPTGSCTGCSFDRKLLLESGKVLGEEAQAEDIAVLLGPAVNIKRSPLCGRNFEYFSEDPYLSGELATAYINGVQSKNVGVSLKHFAANNQETRRLSSDSVVDERTLREIYLPAFETAVKNSQPWTVMCAYNQINGIFAAEHKELLNDILRDEWGFNGIVVSDWGATKDRVKGIEAGMDLQMPGSNDKADAEIAAAVKNGTLSEELLNKTAERILSIIYNYIDNKVDDVKFQHERDHQEARKQAAESMVLLKNDDILPLSRDKKLAFIGEFADKPRFQGGGSSHVKTYKVSSSCDAAEGIDFTYAQGYRTDKDEIDDNLIFEAVNAAKNAETAVLFVGIPNALESEGFDRTHLRLPENQLKLIDEVNKVQKNIVVVVECGGAIEMPWIDDVKAVLYAYLGGEAVGLAINDIIFGDVNPSGKLAETFPIKLEDNPSYLFYFGEGDRVEYREGIFVGYRYYDKKKIDVLFPFGHGLSYTEFEYSNLSLDKSTMKDSEILNVSVKVKNVGSVDGKEIVQLYIGDNESTVIRPVKELRGFEKVSLKTGEETTVNFALDKRAFAYYNTEISDWYVESGDFTIFVGKSSRDIQLEATVNVESTTKIKKIYSMDSTVGEIMQNPIGAGFVEKLMTALPIDAKAGETVGSPDLIINMIKDMSLNTILNLAGGMVTEEQFVGIIAMLNQSQD